MCELLAMSSRRATRLTFSLQALAARSGLGHSSRDGWGAAFYQGSDAALFREPVAASDSPLVRMLENQDPSTQMAISHIRHATLGAISLANTQPFVRELGGHTHVFAHNGHLPGIGQDGRFALRHFHPVGETDSEQAFCALLDRLQSLWQAGDPPALEARLAVVRAFAAELRELGPANFLYADGAVLFAHGHRRIQTSGRIEPPGLFLLERECHDEHEPLQAQGVSVGCGYQQVVLLASVPLSDEPWRHLEEGETVAISEGRLLARHIPPDVMYKR
jgi:predicted glutamine amidotransferase